MDDVMVGTVTSRRGARVHLVRGNRPWCGAGTRAVGNVHPPTADDGPHVCGRCREALRAAVTRAMNVRDRRSLGDLRYSELNRSIVDGYDRLIDALETDEDRREHELFLRLVAESRSGSPM